MSVNLVVTNEAGEDIWLDLYEEEPIKLTFNIEDILTVKPKAEFTRQFRVPATDTNYELFTTIFEIVGVDFNPGAKVPARIVVNGADFRGGELRLQKVYRNDVTKKVDYECVFLGSSKSLASAIGEKTIGELDWNDYTFLLDSPNIITSWQAYPESTINAGLFNGDILFPIVDFGNTYDAGVAQETKISLNHSGPNGSFDQNSHPLPYNRLKPMVRVQEVLRRMFEQNGFTYSGQFFDPTLPTDNRRLYLTAWGDDDSITTNDATSNLAKFKAPNTLTPSIIDGAPFFNLNFNNVEFDYGNNLQIAGTPPNDYVQYNIPTNGDYTYNVVTNWKFSHNENTGGGITVYHNAPDGSSIGYRFAFGPGTGGCAGFGSELTITKNINGGPFGFWANICGNEVPSNPNQDDPALGSTFFYEFTTADEVVLTGATAGQDIIPWELGGVINGDNITLALNDDSYVEITAAVGELNIASQFTTKYKCIDFLKDLFTMFRMVMIPNPSDVNDFQLVPWSQYIGSGQLKDWSNKLVKNKDLVIRPLLLDQKDRLVLTMAEDEDDYNNRNQVVFDEAFGTRQIDSVYDVLEGETTIKTKVAPTPAAQINDYNTNWDNFTIPHIYAIQSEAGVDLKEPIKPKPRILFYDGLNSINTDNWYLEDAAQNPPQSFSTVPVVSFSSQMPQGGPNNFNLLFERETNWAGAPSPYHPITGQDLYTRYWSRYVSLIYNKDSRRVSAYFVLDETDILNFAYNDVIYVEGVYYYVEKIYDAPLGKQSEVKVDLITLKDYKPRVTPVPPASMTLWNTLNVNWENITDNWENV